MKVLLTGSEGFVGRHFQKILPEDWDVICLDFKRGVDVRDIFRSSNTHFDWIIHLAAVVGGRETIDREPLKVAVDLSIDAELFQYALRTKPSRLIYFSSSAAYPVNLQTHCCSSKLTESDIDLSDMCSPDMTYGFAKLAGEYQAKFLQEAGVRTHVFRPFSGYGPDQDLTYPFPSFIQRAKNLEYPFTIWGDGSAVRDFIHIDDIVRAVLAAVDNDVEGPVNLGTGVPTSFYSLAKLVCRTAGYSPLMNNLIDKPEGVKYRVADARKMRSFYLPKISLEEGIKEALYT
jgi:nucleoside-diphosphate-sugar epimerase